MDFMAGLPDQAPGGLLDMQSRGLAVPDGQTSGLQTGPQGGFRSEVHHIALECPEKNQHSTAIPSRGQTSLTTPESQKTAKKARGFSSL